MKIVPMEKKLEADWLAMRLALWPECPREDSLDEIWRIRHSDREAAFLALTDSDVVAGFAEVSTREYVDGCQSTPVGYLEGIYIRPEYRKSGAGAALVQAVEAWARAQGCIEMGSDARIDNLDSIAFHHAVGFRETERQVVFLKELEE